MCCSGEFGEFRVYAEAFEALGHPGGCPAEVGLTVGMRQVRVCLLDRDGEQPSPPLDVSDGEVANIPPFPFDPERGRNGRADRRGG
jgi:hypothetical protein